MENKILAQELKRIDELSPLVNTKEEYDLLVAGAKEIIPFWAPPSERSYEISPRGLEMIALINKHFDEEEKREKSKGAENTFASVFKSDSNGMKGGELIK